MRYDLSRCGALDCDADLYPSEKGNWCDATVANKRIRDLKALCDELEVAVESLLLVHGPRFSDGLSAHAILAARKRAHADARATVLKARNAG